MRTARDLMTAPAHCLAPGDTLVAAARALAEHGVGSMPVIKGDTIVGILTDRDIVVAGVAQELDARTATVDDIMSRDVVTVLADDSTTHVADVLGEHQIRRVPVLDDGRVVGMISQADVALSLSSELACTMLREVSEP